KISIKKPKTCAPKPKKRGRKLSIPSAKFRWLKNQLSKEDPPTLRDLAKAANCHWTTIHYHRKKLYPKKIIKPKVHKMSASTIEKRRLRSWQLYMILRKERWRKVITSDEA